MPNNGIQLPRSAAGAVPGQIRKQVKGDGEVMIVIAGEQFFVPIDEALTIAGRIIASVQVLNANRA